MIKKTSLLKKVNKYVNSALNFVSSKPAPAPAQAVAPAPVQPNGQA